MLERSIAARPRVVTRRNMRVRRDALSIGRRLAGIFARGVELVTTPGAGSTIALVLLA
jgi:hypothetical protein